MDDLRGQYFKEYLQKGFLRIFEEQRRIAAAKIYSRKSARSRSGALMNALRSPSWSISTAGAGVEARVDYPTYLRFLDMKRLGNYKIYNRPVWGILYKETFRDLKYEFRDWLTSQLHESLTDALNPLTK